MMRLLVTANAGAWIAAAAQDEMDARMTLVAPAIASFD